jgi:hypothetical protein
MREWRKTHRLTGEALKRANVRSYANTYLGRGHIERTPCADCGGPGEQMHHDDYDRPLDVTWLCKPCHRERHKVAA